MKVKDELIIANIDDGFVAVDSDTTENRFNGMIKLNETAKYILEKLQKDISYEDLLKDYINEYEISEELGKKDIDIVLNKLEESKVLIK